VTEGKKSALARYLAAKGLVVQNSAGLFRLTLSLQMCVCPMSSDVSWLHSIIIIIIIIIIIVAFQAYNVFEKSWLKVCCSVWKKYGNKIICTYGTSKACTFASVKRYNLGRTVCVAWPVYSHDWNPPEDTEYPYIIDDDDADSDSSSPLTARQPSVLILVDNT